MKPSFEVISKEVWTEARGSIFFHGSYFVEDNFMSAWMWFCIKNFMKFTRKHLPRFVFLRRICRSNCRTFGEMGPDLLFAEASMIAASMVAASMVAASMDASVEVVVMVPHHHRHSYGRKVL